MGTWASRVTATQTLHMMVVCHLLLISLSRYVPILEEGLQQDAPNPENQSSIP